MRVLIDEYPGGKRRVSEMTNEGDDFVGEWTAPGEVNGAVCSSMQVACDDTDAGYQRLLETLAWLAEEIKKRKLQAVEAP